MSITQIHVCGVYACQNRKDMEWKQSLMCRPCMLNTIRRFLILGSPFPLTNGYIEDTLVGDKVDTEIDQQIHRTFQYILFNQKALLEIEQKNYTGKGHVDKDYI